MNSMSFQKAIERETQNISEIDLSLILRVLWRRKWIIVTCALFGVICGAYYGFAVAVPKYSATTRVALEVRNQQIVDLQSVISGVSTEQAAINTELEVVQSRGLVERLVTKLKLDQDPEFNSHLRPPSLLSIGGLRGRAVRFVPALAPEEPTKEEQFRASTAAVIDALSVTSTRNTYLFEIRATTTDPLKSAELANTLAEIYLEYQIGVKFEATSYATTWLSERVTELEVELKQKEDAVRELKAESDLISAESLEALNVRAKNLRELLIEAQTRVSTEETRAQRLADIVIDENYGAIAQELGDAILGRLYKTMLAGDVAAVKLFEARVTTLRDQAQFELNRARSQYNALLQSVDNIQARVSEQNEDNIRIIQLEREANATRALYETFLTRFKETSVQVGLYQSDSRILSPAIRGVRIEPRVPLIITLSLILGTMLGGAVVLYKQFFYEGYRTVEELEEGVGLPVLGHIPKVHLQKRQALLDYLKTHSSSAAVEAIRNLRTSIMLSNMDSSPQVLMMTSSLAGEGKTTTSIALAHNLSSLEKKVLLVEGDMRRRVFSQYFQAPEGATGGMAAMLLNEVALEDSVFKDEVAGIDVLVGGKANINAADLFASDRFAEFIKHVRKTYDYIVVDMPPVLAVPDARVVAQLADSVIYAVLWDQTNRRTVAEGLRLLASVNAPVLGLVMSRVNSKEMNSYGYSYGYDYD
jgi:capsular exopolysaccharide synthesis family protein